MPLTALLFWIIYVGGACAAVVAPAVGVAVYVLVYHMNPESQWWGGTFDASGIRPSLTIAVATVLGIVLRRPRLPDGGRQFPATVILMLALAAYALLTLSWADLSWSPSLYMAEKACKLAIFLLILVRCVHTPRQYLLVFLSWLIGVVYLGYEAWGHMGTHVRGRLAVGLGGPDFAESSDLAVHLVASLPLVGALFFSSRTWWGRVLALVTGALAVNTIVMTRTRNVLVGVAAMSCMACFWLPRGYRFKGLAAIVVGMILAVHLTDPGWWKRMSTVAHYERDASVENRLVYWNAAANMAANQPLGVGLGQFRLRVQEYTPQNPYEHSAHSTYMSCLAELGLPGALLLAALLAAAFGQLSRIRRGAGEFESDVRVAMGPWCTRFHLGWHAMALQSALVGYLGCAVFCTRLWAEDFWILLGLVACLGNVGADLRAGSVRAEVAPSPTLAAGPALAGSPAPASATLGGS